MREGADAKPKRPWMIGFTPDPAFKAEILEFKDSYPIKVSTAFVCSYLIRKGLDAVKAEKEAANG